MKNRIISIAASLVATALAVSSCSEDSKVESVALGEVQYYDSFLWSDADTSYLEKTVVLEFNKDAINQKSGVDIAFTDNNQRPISTSELEIIYDGKRAKNNTIRITPKSSSEEEAVSIKFRFPPKAKDGKHQGYMVAKPLGIAAVNNIEVQSDTQIMQWTIYFNHAMNPLKKGLLIALAVIVAGIIIARLILHRKTFGGTAKKSINVTGPTGRIIYGPKTTRLGGYSEVRFCNKAEKQSFVNAFFYGKTLFVVSSAFTSPLRLTPGRKKEIKIAGAGYSFTRNKMNYNDVAIMATENSSKNKILFA